MARSQLPNETEVEEHGSATIRFDGVVRHKAEAWAGSAFDGNETAQAVFDRLKTQVRVADVEECEELLGFLKNMRREDDELKSSQARAIERVRRELTTAKAAFRQAGSEQDDEDDEADEDDQASDQSLTAGSPIEAANDDRTAEGADISVSTVDGTVYEGTVTDVEIMSHLDSFVLESPTDEAARITFRRLDDGHEMQVYEFDTTEGLDVGIKTGYDDPHTSGQSWRKLSDDPALDGVQIMEQPVEDDDEEQEEAEDTEAVEEGEAVVADGGEGPFDWLTEDDLEPAEDGIGNKAFCTLLTSESHDIGACVCGCGRTTATLHGQRYVATWTEADGWEWYPTHVAHSADTDDEDQEDAEDTEDEEADESDDTDESEDVETVASYDNEEGYEFESDEIDDDEITPMPGEFEGTPRCPECNGFMSGEYDIMGLPAAQCGREGCDGFLDDSGMIGQGYFVPEAESDDESGADEDEGNATEDEDDGTEGDARDADGDVTTEGTDEVLDEMVDDREDDEADEDDDPEPIPVDDPVPIGDDVIREVAMEANHDFEATKRLLASLGEPSDMEDLDGYEEAIAENALQKQAAEDAKLVRENKKGNDVHSIEHESPVTIARVIDPSAGQKLAGKMPIDVRLPSGKPERTTLDRVRPLSDAERGIEDNEGKATDGGEDDESGDADAESDDSSSPDGVERPWLE